MRETRLAEGFLAQQRRGRRSQLSHLLHHPLFFQLAAAAALLVVLVVGGLDSVGGINEVVDSPVSEAVGNGVIRVDDGNELDAVALAVEVAVVEAALEGVGAGGAQHVRRRRVVEPVAAAEGVIRAERRDVVRPAVVPAAEIRLVFETAARREVFVDPAVEGVRRRRVAVPVEREERYAVAVRRAHWVRVRHSHATVEHVAHLHAVVIVVPVDGIAGVADNRQTAFGVIREAVNVAVVRVVVHWTLGNVHIWRVADGWREDRCSRGR